ncbi:hypothetical protein DCS32_00440 [Dokdonia sp. Dokd-P16]|nr:hypothetical protein DCS32_00440 [Dokdonia sp. Dokd-P16]
MKKNLNLLLVIAAILTIFGCGSDESSNEEMTITPVNSAPNSFSLLTVSNEAVNVALKPTLTWNASIDLDNDPVTYDLILDNNPSPNTVIASNLIETEFTLSDPLEFPQIFYWKVIAKDNNGNSTESGIFSFTTIDLFSQTTDVVTGLSNPAGLVFDGNDLYVAEVGANKVSKINVQATNPDATDVLTGLFTFRLAISGNELYISQPQANLISKTDITATTPTVTPVVSGTNGASGLAFDVNDLYVTAPDANEINKLDISIANPTLENVTILDCCVRPDELLLNGNDLYIALRTANKIIKLDISTTPPTSIDVATGLSNPAGLALDGNTLYIAEYNGNKISKIDITSTTTTVTDVITGLSGPRGLALNGNQLFIAEYNGNKISKIYVQ